MRAFVLATFAICLTVVPGVAQKGNPETEYQHLKRLREVFQKSQVNERKRVLDVIDYRLMLIEMPGIIPFEDRPGMKVRSDERSSDAFLVHQIIDKQTFVGRTFANGRWHYSLIKGVSTEGFVDDRTPIIPPGVFFETSSVKRNGRTMLQYAATAAPEPPSAADQAAFENALKSLRLPTASSVPKEDAEKREKAAAARLGLIRQILATGDRSSAIYHLRKLIREDAGTRAAREAENLLEKLEK